MNNVVILREANKNIFGVVTPIDILTKDIPQFENEVKNMWYSYQNSIYAVDFDGINEDEYFVKYFNNESTSNFKIKTVKFATANALC